MSVRGILQGLGIPLALAGATVMAAGAGGDPRQIAGIGVALLGVGLVWAGALLDAEWLRPPPETCDQGRMPPRASSCPAAQTAARARTAP